MAQVLEWLRVPYRWINWYEEHFGTRLWMWWHWRDIRAYKKAWQLFPLEMAEGRLRRAKLKLATYREKGVPRIIIDNQLTIIKTWEERVEEYRRGSQMP